MPSGFKEISALLAVLALALAIRVHRLDHESAWFDEISTLQHLDAPTLSEFLKRCYDFNPVPPLYLAVQYGWGRFVGTDVMSQRVLSIIFGMTGLVAMYGLSRVLFGPKAALWTVAWMTLLPWHILHSQEIRFYGLVTLLAALSMWVFVKAAARPTPWGAFLVGGINCAMVWTHPISVFLFAVQGAFLLLFRRSSVRFLLSWFIVHIAVAASLLVFLKSVDWDHTGALTEWIPLPGLSNTGQGPISFLRSATGTLDLVVPASDTLSRNPLTAALAPAKPLIRWALTGIAVLIPAMALAGLIRGRNDGTPVAGIQALSDMEKAVMLALWFFLPPLCAFVFSYAWRPVFLDRYLFYSMLPLYLLIGKGLASSRSTALSVCALSLPALVYGAFYYPIPFRVPMDVVVKIIREHSGQNPTIYASAQVDPPSIKFHWPDPDPEVHFPPAYLQVVDGEIPAPGECWFVLANRRLPLVSSKLDQRGETYEVWKLPWMRPIVVVHWIPQGDQTSESP